MKLTALKEFFVKFIHSRHIARHFRRLAILDSLQDTRISRDLPKELTDTLLSASKADIDNLLVSLGSHSDGLTAAEADNIRSLKGPNEIQHEKKLSAWFHLWHCYKNPFNILLSILSLTAYLTGDVKSATVIGLMVLLSTLLRFVQEAKSNSAADALKAMVSNTASTIRCATNEHETTAPMGAALWKGRLPSHTELPIEQLVPGDIVLLSAGDMVPADCRVATAKDLFIAQAALTGESLPIEKFSQGRDQALTNPIALDNIVFMGTNVVSGSATAIVLTTGNDTYFGALAQRVTAADTEATSFQKGVNEISWLLIRFMCVMAPLVLIINGVTKGDWTQALLFSLSVAVGLTPEMLPMIVTSTLAKGAVFLSRQKVIVKRLDAIQNLGAMDILCTDKTGTLTQDKIFLANHLDAWGEESAEVLQMAYLNSYYQTGLKNLLDVAVLEHVEVHRELEVTSAFSKVDEIPFDFNRRRMSVVVCERNQRHLLICKGAVDEVLAVCRQVQHANALEDLTEGALQRIKQLTDNLNQDGLRVVAVALKPESMQKKIYSLADERDLILIGYIAFLDPPKESAAPTIKALAAQGIAVKILTGDNMLVTAKVCREVGLKKTMSLTGAAIELMQDEELSLAVERDNVFAQLTPIQKERIVRLLRNNGHVVGFMGDGINDAAALRAADVGISIDTAVDIAKEAADIILLEKNLLILHQGVIEGRRTFANMVKYIKMTASSNFGNMFSVVVASAFIPFLPMLPMHLLVQNLLYDISQTAIPFDNVDKEQLRQPQHWHPGDIGRFMIFFGPISSIFDITTFAFLWFVLSANSIAKQTLFQSGWFVVGVLTQTLVVHMIRTRKIPFVQSQAATPLVIMTIVVAAVAIFLPMGPLAPYLKLQALPAPFFMFIPLLLAGYMVTMQAVKVLYTRHYKWH